MSTTAALLTVDDFLKLPGIENENVELIHGVVVPSGQANFGHELLKARVMEPLAYFCSQHPIGKVFAESPYRLEKHSCPHPDVSVLLKERIDTSIKGLFRGAPDLAIEVVSSESADVLSAKIELYLKHGSKAVWVFYPNQRHVIVHKPGGQLIKLDENQTLVDHDVLPGFSVPLKEIFEGL